MLIYRFHLRKKTLFNIKGAGRPAIHDRGVRHIARDEIKRLTVLHLTVKIEKTKAGLRNKDTLKLLHRAILKARKQGLSILHYTLEYDHVHMMVEADDKTTLSKGMQAFGITFSKGVNRLKVAVGRVFKTRYDYRKLKTPTEIKNTLNYILGNSTKHKSGNFVHLYNSLGKLGSFERLYPAFEFFLDNLFECSHALKKLADDLEDVLDCPQSLMVKQFV